MLTYVWYFAWIVFFFAWMFVTASCLTLRKQDTDENFYEDDAGPHRNDRRPFDASHLQHGLQYIYFENAGN